MGSTTRKKSRDRRKKKIPIKSKSILKSSDKTQSNAATPANTVWENIVLHYLAKLRSAWCSGTQNQHPTPGTRQSADVRFKHSGANQAKTKIPPKARATPTPEKYTSSNHMPVRKNRSKSQHSLASAGSDTMRKARRKALTIVTNALEYGRSKGIISKNGKFFWLRNEKEDGYPCSDCKSCQYLNHKTNKCLKDDKSMDTTSGLSIYDVVPNDKAPRDKNEKFRSKYQTKRNNSDDDYLHVDCDCKRCRGDRKRYE